MCDAAQKGQRARQSGLILPCDFSPFSCCLKLPPLANSIRHKLLSVTQAGLPRLRCISSLHEAAGPSRAEPWRRAAPEAAIRASAASSCTARHAWCRRPTPAAAAQMRGVWGRRAAIPGHAAETFWEGVWGRLAAVTSGKWIRGELHRAAARGLNGVKARQGKSTNKRSESLTYFSFPRGSQLFSLLALPRTRGELRLLFPLYFLILFFFFYSAHEQEEFFFLLFDGEFSCIFPLFSVPSVQEKEALE